MGKRPDLAQRNRDNAKYKNKNKRLYKIWDGMKQRCLNPNNKDYKNYGGRGIKINAGWRKDFNLFQNWALNNFYEEGLSIDRIDVNGNYEPENCRWVDNKKQQRNRRNNFLITYNNETHCLAEWADIVNINRKALRYRLKNWDSVEKCFLTPLNKHK